MDGDGKVDCPYDFVDKADHNSSSGSSNKSTYAFSATTQNPSPFSDADTYSDSGDYVMSFWNVFEEFFLLIFSIIFGSAFLFFPLLGIWAILHSILDLIFSPFTKRWDENKRDSFITAVSFLILLFAASILFLQPSVRALIRNPDRLSAVIFLAALIFLLLLYICYCIQKDKNSLSADNGKLRVNVKDLNKKVADLEKQLLDTQNSLLTQKESAKHHLNSAVAFSEHQIELLKADNELLRMELKAALLTPSSTSNIHEVDIEDKFLSPIPDYVHYNKDGIPVKGTVSNTKPFGDYTVYVSSHSKIYHSEFICGGTRFSKPVHIYDVISDTRPCKRCGKYFGSEAPEWYITAKQLAVYKR